MFDHQILKLLAQDRIGNLQALQRFLAKPGAHRFDLFGQPAVIDNFANGFFHGREFDSLGSHAGDQLDQVIGAVGFDRIRDFAGGLEGKRHVAERLRQVRGFAAKRRKFAAQFAGAGIAAQFAGDTVKCLAGGQTALNIGDLLQIGAFNVPHAHVLAVKHHIGFAKVVVGDLAADLQFNDLADVGVGLHQQIKLCVCEQLFGQELLQKRVVLALELFAKPLGIVGFAGQLGVGDLVDELLVGFLKHLGHGQRLFFAEVVRRNLQIFAGGQLLGQLKLNDAHQSVQAMRFHHRLNNPFAGNLHAVDAGDRRLRRNHRRRRLDDLYPRFHGFDRRLHAWLRGNRHRSDRRHRRLRGNGRGGDRVENLRGRRRGMTGRAANSCGGGEDNSDHSFQSGSPDEQCNQGSIQAHAGGVKEACLATFLLLTSAPSARIAQLDRALVS